MKEVKRISQLLEGSTLYYQFVLGVIKKCLEKCKTHYEPLFFFN